jgi:hypothetical protein
LRLAHQAIVKSKLINATKNITDATTGLITVNDDLQHRKIIQTSRELASMAKSMIAATERSYEVLSF